jgi:hypothetical protein
VGYLGFEGVAFNDLWPVFLGVVLSIGLGVRFFVARSPGPGEWPELTLLALAPFAAGFGYLRVLVVGRPPHFKEDLLVTALAIRLDFTEPPIPAFPVIPRLKIDAAAACGPGRASDERHPIRPGA